MLTSLALRRLFAAGLVAVLFGLLVVSPAPTRVSATPPLAPALAAVPTVTTVPVLVPPPDNSWVTVDTETTVDPEFSHVDDYSVGTHYIVRAQVDYFAKAAGYTVKCWVFDPDDNDFHPAFCGPNSQTDVVTTKAITESVLWAYYVPVNSTYGQYLADPNNAPSYALLYVEITDDNDDVVYNETTWVTTLLTTAP